MLPIIAPAHRCALAAALAAVLALAPAPLAAGDRDIEVRGEALPSIVLRYPASALATEAGVRTLRARVRSAAEILCAPEIELPLYTSGQAKLCARETRDDGYAQIERARAREAWASAAPAIGELRLVARR